MESNHIENQDSDFKSRIVLAVCFAGSDRSSYVKQELEKRGYVASNGGVLKNHNYVTEEDLTNVGSVIFSSEFEKKEFEKNTRLKKALENSGAKVFTMNITESEKERALQQERLAELKIKISEQLDMLGFVNLK